MYLAGIFAFGAESFEFSTAENASAIILTLANTPTEADCEFACDRRPSCNGIWYLFLNTQGLLSLDRCNLLSNLGTNVTTSRNTLSFARVRRSTTAASTTSVSTTTTPQPACPTGNPCIPNFPFTDRTGTFNVTQGFPTGSNGVASMVAMDYNGDAAPDVLYVVSAPGALRLALNNGFGSFTHSTLANISVALWVTTGDLNGDGLSDIVALSFQSTITVMESLGNGGYSTRTLPAFSTFSNVEVHIGDINGNGVNDVIVVTRQRRLVWYADGRGTGAAILVPGNAQSELVSAAPGDYNKDGRLDFVLAYRTPAQFTYLQGTGNAAFATAVVLASVATPLTVFAHDWDNDGDLDVAGATTGSPSRVYMFQNDGSAFMAARIIDSSLATVRSIRPFDIENDGRMEILLAAQVDDKVKLEEEN